MSTVFMSCFMLITSILSHIEGVDHAIYISVTKIELDTENGEIYVSMKVFSDDLEDAIHNHSGKREKVIGREEFSGLVSVLQKYLDSRFKIELDEQQIKLIVDSAENIGDTTWIYLQGEIEDVSNLIEIRNEVLFEIFDTQKNILEVNFKMKTYYFNLNKDQPNTIISL